MITHAPNTLQSIALSLVSPSEENVRLFVERESLATLRDVYRRHLKGEDVVLPDAPVVRFTGYASDNTTPLLEILAGERRLTAATLEGVQQLDMRVVNISSDEAYRFILAHNDVAGLTTAELCYRAAEMDRLGFTDDEISDALNGGSPFRYIAVGEMIDPKWFTDEKKLCDPSIIEWYEASQYGIIHFTRCFKAWNSGLWDAKRCSKEFRKRGKALPLDNAEKGFRISYNGNRLVVRGQLDLDFTDEVTAIAMLTEMESHIARAKEKVRTNSDFGAREVYNINPTTL